MSQRPRYWAADSQASRAALPILTGLWSTSRGATRPEERPGRARREATQCAARDPDEPATSIWRRAWSPRREDHRPEEPPGGPRREATQCAARDPDEPAPSIGRRVWSPRRDLPAARVHWA